MLVNDLPLPTSFVELVRSAGTPEHWVLGEDVDAYGNVFDAELRLHHDLETIERYTGVLPVHFEAQVSATPEERQGMDATSADEPGFIPCLFDFAKVVWFGNGHEDSPFCFDFRDNLQAPSIIYWDDVYWQRVAPNFDTFISLYKPDDDVNWTCADPVEPIT
jgi:hypothetical protein